MQVELFNNFENLLWEQLRQAGHGLPRPLRDPLPLTLRRDSDIKRFLIAHLHGMGQYRIMWGFDPAVKVAGGTESLLGLFQQAVITLVRQPRAETQGLTVGAVICSDTVAIAHEEEDVSAGWVRPYRYCGGISVLVIACNLRERELLKELIENKATIEQLSHEVAERKRAEEALQAANQKVQALYEQSEASTRAKSTFLANMSHELRTPMNGIIGFTELLLREPLGTDQQEYVEIISKSARDLLSLLNDLLDISKVEAQKMTLEKIVFDPIDLALEACEMVSPKLRDGRVLLLADFDPGLTKLVGDPTRFRQVLINLLGNAVKYTEAGSVRIVMRRMTGGGLGIQSLMARIEDSGVGIEAQYLSRLFQAFTQSDETTTRKYGGTGLGLAITKNLVELMGGKISVESEIGKGTTFTLVIPFGESGEPRELSRWGKNNAPSDFPGYCLLLDSRKESRESLVPALESLGLVVFVADSYDAALALSQHIQFPIRVVDLPSLRDPVSDLQAWSRERSEAPLIGIQPSPYWAPTELRSMLSGLLSRPAYTGSLARRLWDAWSNRNSI